VDSVARVEQQDHIIDEKEDTETDGCTKSLLDDVRSLGQVIPGDESCRGMPAKLLEASSRIFIKGRLQL
jgi:hypothetical protein